MTSKQYIKVQGKMFYEFKILTRNDITYKNEFIKFV